VVKKSMGMEKRTSAAKARSFLGFCGTAEAVPLSETKGSRVEGLHSHSCRNGAAP
jgi:hypothetical protein